ncbi:DUF5107 domain-containing protein [Amycolatopsis antarctica]|uniref:DUF5107 domain-containing protein n=1 Tax=Amycolatopsis antarctica TaxID=1854586 RepID=A0A263D087_9PSEU|nr:DUF5107 domain-containing protein [Amycolatopsis antarctica]OZM70956.1 DUF5107 domain-containing protein [Amycolatopsis antarctica]
MVTRLHVEKLTLPVAPLGAENPLPPLTALRAAQQVANADELPAEMRTGVRYGQLDSVLPCMLQDGYGRDRAEESVPALVLENEHLRATVLPSLGGRLFSLWDKDSQRELLFRNPVLQPANLALRGAWFAGGVEWNLGSTGHTTQTCAPMHAGLVEGPDGAPVLRLWEWERTRNLPYQLDFWLPEDSTLLHVGVRVRNPHEEDVPLYWWSNIAVEQTDATRVLAPAGQAWHYGYSGRLDLVPVPGAGSDLTYPMRHEHAADFFFDVPEGTTPWIAALDGDGRGLVQASTARLRGRKLFVWGESEGGRRWQDWLAPGARTGYLEIQAGLARTQLEHLRLPAGGSLDWVEAYGPLSATQNVHSGDWTAATSEVDTELRGLLPSDGLDGALTRWRGIADDEPREILHAGSGWGALEAERLRRDGAAPVLAGTPFALDGLDQQQRPWLALLDGADAALDADPIQPPPGTLVAPWWRDALEAAEPNWAVWYHRGVARWYGGDRHGAVAAWKASAWKAANPWAFRNLAVFASMEGQPEEAAALLADAVRLAPEVRQLAVEAVTATLAAGAPAEALALLDGLPAEFRTGGRFRLLTARALLASGEAAAALAVYEEGFEVPDVREGETSLSDTWAEIQAALGGSAPLPARYDFRMAEQ